MLLPLLSHKKVQFIAQMVIELFSFLFKGCLNEQSCFHPLSNLLPLELHENSDSIPHSWDFVVAFTVGQDQCNITVKPISRASFNMIRSYCTALHCSRMRRVIALQGYLVRAREKHQRNDPSAQLELQKGHPVQRAGSLIRCCFSRAPA